MATTIHFNTGRLYTAHKQRITATQHDDGVITFMDHDRMIPGELVWGRAFTAVAILAAYDANAYKNTTRAMNDGMMRGGCNTQYEEKAA